MKQFLIVVLLFAFIAGCSEKKEPDEKNVSQNPDTTGVLKTEKDNNPPKEVTLNYQLAKDDHIIYRLTTMSKSSQTLVSDTTLKQVITQNLTYTFNMDVVDVDSDKLMDIKATVTNVVLDADANGQKFNYRSGQKLDSLQRMRFMEYEAILNNPFYFRLDPKGEITEIYRVDKIINKFLELQNLQDSATTEIRKQLQFNITDVALKPLLVQIFRTLPKHTVAKDSSWTNKYKSQLAVFEIENTAKYKIADFEKDDVSRYAVINAGLDIKASGKNKVSERGVNYDFKNPQAQASGKIYFNLNRGLVEKSKTSTKLIMSMSMNMPQTPKGPMNARRDDVIESTNIVELL